ncbi:hypothetical protein IEQ34_004131 [Dendrobium chrysotoxum]|uniref:Uncharacterized protein n=1 Tax=Dendrobium chrysotoxum TaxID=161865 RepID=A0AAV7HHE9_DENCH|nr:hypothetical protein IEQ34_004131 [Dendrobium chrysotoxum]
MTGRWWRRRVADDRWKSIGKQQQLAIDGREVCLDGRDAEEITRSEDQSGDIEARETTGGHGRGGNLNPLRGRENPEVEILEGKDGMPPLKPLCREDMSMGYERRGADFVGKRGDFYYRGADLERRRGEADKGYGYDRRREDRDNWGAFPLRGMGGYG